MTAATDAAALLLKACTTPTGAKPSMTAARYTAALADAAFTTLSVEKQAEIRQNKIRNEFTITDR